MDNRSHQITTTQTGETMSNIKRARNILQTCINAVDSSPKDYELFELKELIQKIMDKTSSEDDFWLDLEGGEVRLIDEDAIDEIWTDSLIDQIKECYDLPDLPPFVAIDWEETAKNCKVDGLGHHFASYDHNEHNSENWHIFRTN